MTKSKFTNLLYRASILAICLWAILASKHLSFYNQGDFSRAIGYILTQPIDGLIQHGGNSFGFIWGLANERNYLHASLNSSNLFFEIAALIFGIFSNVFDLFALALVAKLIVLAIVYKIAEGFSDDYQWNRLTQLFAFLILTLATFAAHNITVLNTFYQEYAFFVFFPLVIYYLIFNNKHRECYALAAATLMCALAKVQYFYFPTLVILAVYLKNLFNKHPCQKKTIALLVFIQLLGFASLVRNHNSNLNHYHATRYGSYLVMTDSELSALGVTEEQRTCIGVDAWNNKIETPSSLYISQVNHECMPESEISTLDVIRPYLNYPGIFFRLLSNISIKHFSVQYFHVTIDNNYLVPTSNDGFKQGNSLIQISIFRDKILTPMVTPWIIIIGSILPFFGNTKNSPNLKIISLFLTLFIASQLVICILGEGIRDLSRHLSAAQYAMDFFSFIVLVQLYALLRNWIGKRKQAPDQVQVSRRMLYALESDATRVPTSCSRQ